MIERYHSPTPGNIQPLLYWCKEREQIRLKRQWRAEGLRQGGVGPLTSDPILADYRFCNVRRRDDRVSQWLIKNVYTQDNINKGVSAFVMFLAWCRWVNWPPSIKFVLDERLYPREGRPIDWREIGSAVDHISETGKAWTGAYMVRADKPGVNKGKFVSEEVIGIHLQAKIQEIVVALASGPTYREIVELLCEVKNFGSFMAGQVAGDLTYTPLLAKASDLKTWAPMGPGSIRGFNRIMGNYELSRKPSEELWLGKLAEWRTAIISELGSEYDNITALDVQNCLCETDKYLRVKNGEGKPRATYQHHVY